MPRTKLQASIEARRRDPKQELRRRLCTSVSVGLSQQGMRQKDLAGRLKMNAGDLSRRVGRSSQPQMLSLYEFILIANELHLSNEAILEILGRNVKQ